MRTNSCVSTLYFYPRSPCGERLPVRQVLGFGRNFYPRSPCGERPTGAVKKATAEVISIHALLAESDRRDKPPPLFALISIHALLAESDANWFDLWGWAEYFYPRSPCGERHAWSASKLAGMPISIHALLAESDISDAPSSAPYAISIHALLAESDDCVKYCIRAPGISIHALLAESDV